ncbi:hypothetical protein BP6252_01756 [Coleophoma cylindrospora]|uniref:non-specific serine/threonine protein kinase n=1 Tax=Coleophoma cylindrospora TaxID=1849047 RepID=A0A3D8STZ0_9HELO|nr:hypothetical protein BP6252_01756 [Coleophoma cylindrospora]
MSLVPYSSRDSREIVLRHDDAIVVRDPLTQQLMLRGASPDLSLSECPTCHRPFRSASPERKPSPHRQNVHQTAFISPEYFRMLQHVNDGPEQQSPPSSPIRRLVQPDFSSPGSTGGSVADAEFVASTPDPLAGHRIKRDAFSPNYFRRFFIEEKELGRGGKGVVLLVRHELDGVSLGQFACKRVPVGNDHAWLEKVLIEVQLLQGLSHPNLVSYRHVWLEDAQLNRFNPPVPCAFILQQYCNSGDLLHYIAGPGPVMTSTNEQLKEQMRRKSRGRSERPDMKPSQRKLTFEEIYSFFKDISSGLAHLHSSNYIHRDLKPSNCLLHRDGNEFRCLISDFGEVQAENVVRKSTGNTGTISYCAPEVLKQDATGRYGNFTTKSDIFSLGMILYFMCFGRLPYKSADCIQEEYEDIDTLRAEISTWTGFQDERRERPELPNQLYDFLKRLLAVDPANRPSANEIMHALRTEKGLETPSRRNSGNGPALGARRIHSLDPPNLSDTPHNEPRRAHSGAYIEDAPSESSITPPSSPNAQRKDVAESASSTSRPNSPPLLMAPPTTRFSAFQNHIAVYEHHVRSWMILNAQTLLLLVRLVGFSIKMYMISGPCLPAGTRPIVGYPLMLLAALEVGLGANVDLRISAVLFALHALVVMLGLRRGVLCAERVGLHWMDD